MKTTKIVTAGKLLAFLFISSLALSSCSKDDDNSVVSSPYVGTWVVVTSSGFLAPTLKTSVPPLMTTRKTMVITENTYTDMTESGILGIYSPSMGAKGSMSVSGDVLTMTAKQDGQVDDYGILKFVDIPVAEQVTMKSKWSVLSNKLTLITDANSNGKFDDADDVTTVYTKK